MKKKILAVSCIAVLSGCGAGGSDTGMTGLYSNGTVVSNDAPDRFAGPTDSSASTAVESQTFMVNAFRDGAGEIELSRLALQRAAGDDTRKFAQRMIDHHTQANQEITQLAQAKNIPLPTELGSEHRALLEKLSNLNGPEFDRAYMDRNVEVHEKDVRRFEERSANEQDADIRAFAAATLPVLSAHLQSAREIRDRLRAGAQ